jgi:hypothetical protein
MTTTVEKNVSETTLRNWANDLGLCLSRRDGMYHLWVHNDGWGGGYQGWDHHPSCWNSQVYPLTLWDVTQVLREEKKQALDS